MSTSAHSAPRQPRPVSLIAAAKRILEMIAAGPDGTVLYAIFPLHSSPQPSKVQPLSATGTNETRVPACPGASQAVRQSSPSASARTPPFPLMRTEIGELTEPPPPPGPASPPPPSVAPPPAPEPPPEVFPVLDPQALDSSTASAAQTRRPGVMTAPSRDGAANTLGTNWGPTVSDGRGAQTRDTPARPLALSDHYAKCGPIRPPRRGERDLGRPNA